MSKNTFIIKHKLMNLIKFSSLIVLGLVVFASCSGDSGSNGDGADNSTPSNLVVTATVAGANTQNPNGDGSGSVTFSINATNATSYKIALGDGNTQEITDGNLTYAYTTSGTKTYVVYVSAYNGAKFVSTSVSVTIYVASAAIWSDEFNNDGAPDSSKWGYDLGAGGWGNNELQYYTNRSENVYVSNGTLKIVTKKESYLGSSYTSSRMLTKGKFSFKYGKIEMRAKLPKGGGTWPAFWMLGDNIDTVGWPACGEIDVMEHVGNSLNIIHGTLHSPGRSGASPDTGTTTITNATEEFHIYTAEWTAASIKFYVDNTLFYTFANSTSFPFNNNFFIIVNSAIGGNFGGTIDSNFTSSTYEIDYIRVYN